MFNILELFYYKCNVDTGCLYFVKFALVCHMPELSVCVIYAHF